MRILDEDKAKKNSVPRAASSSVQLQMEIPTASILPMTELKAAPELETIEVPIVTVEEFRKRADRFIEMKFKNN